jgi:S-adenosylmethionine:tRNA ribosyltransferase-isomerase
VNVLEFSLSSSLEAHEPPEARGLARDDVRLLVARGSGSPEITHHRFTELPSVLRSGDVLVVNTSATLPAAVPVAGRDLAVHFSTVRPDGRWLVELRCGLHPYRDAVLGSRFSLVGGASVELIEPYSTGRLWVASVKAPGDFLGYLGRHGSPIRYGYVPRAWPLAAYQTVFAREPGSAEMPSAGRPFTDRLVTLLVTAGVLVVPVLLHTGVASPEAHERPYPERFAVPDPTARVVNAVRDGGGRVIAVGTTVVRALESAARDDGTVRAAGGVTDLVVDEARGVKVVDGLLTGFHEPRASHLDMLAAIAGRDLLGAAYRAAIEGGYLWHEFGDLNVLLP